MLEVDAGNGDDGGGVDIGTPWQYDDGTGASSYRDPGLIDGIEGAFTGTATTLGAPVLVYPLDNSLHPNNLNNITFQWDTGANQYVRVDIQASDAVYHFYMYCGAQQCKNPMPKAEWADLGVKYAGQEVAITLNGIEVAGGPVHVSPTYKIAFSPEPLDGALYYWSSGKGAINRATFGSDGAVPFIYPNSTTNSYACTACHSVSRDGNYIAFAVSAPGGENFAGIQVSSTEDPANPILEPTAGDDGNPVDNLGANVALSPDGSLAAINGVGTSLETRDLYFEMRDATTGMQIARYYMGDNDGPDNIFGGGNLPLFPEFSPDGTQIAVQMSYHNDYDPPISCVWTNNSCASGISVLDVAEDGSIEAARHIVLHEWYGSKVMHFYPTWSPDGKYIAFVSGLPTQSELNGGTGQGSFQNRSGALRIVRSDAPSGTTCPGADCWELANGTGYPMGSVDGFRSTWPKFTPFAQRDADDLYFISFTTNRNYGFETVNLAQLWMFGIDAAKLGTGDASYAPIWLPYQNTTEENLEPYWTETLPCEVGTEGGCSGCIEGESCITVEDGSCYCAAVVK